MSLLKRLTRTIGSIYTETCKNFWFLHQNGVVMMRRRLKQERLGRRMSCSDVAKALGMTERAYRYLEAGQRGPSWETASKLAKLMGVPAEELLVQDSTNGGETESA